MTVRCHFKPCITIKMEISYISEQKYKFWQLPEEPTDQTIWNFENVFEQI